MEDVTLASNVQTDVDTLWIRVVSQVGIYATFLLYLLWAVRRGAREWIPLVGAVLYAILFEHLNMLRYAGLRGSYTYHPDSWLFVWGDVPLYVALAWGFILATSLRLTDRLKLAAWAKPFCDALLALLIDLSLDVVAIRLRFWFWRDIPFHDGFFGVPADNFVGWLLVAFTYALGTRWLRGELGGLQPNVLPQGAVWKWAIWQWIVVPPVAFVLYLALERVVHLTYFVTGLTTLRGQLVVLAGLIGLFVAIVLRGRVQEHPAHREGNPSLQEELSLHVPRQIFHLFGLVGLLFVAATERSPALWLITLGVLGIEWAVVYRTTR